MSIKKNFFAPLASGLGATRRAAMLLLVMMLTTATAWATTTSTINVGGTDYTLFTGFTATSGTNVSATAYNYPKLVDGNLDASSSWHLNNDAQPYYIEFNSDDPIIPKGYIFNTYSANNFKPTDWVLKAKADAGDSWTTLSSKSEQSLASGQEFQYACDNSGNNAYKYFRFEVSNDSKNIWLTEIRLYGSIPNVYYTHLTVKAATCTETGIKQDCYQRNDGKYFTDETGATELAESDVIDPMIPHSGDHHDATDVNIEYWQCSKCSKYFSDSGYTTEITEEQTKIYRTITIDGSISSLVTSDVSQALAGETIALYVSHLIDASTLKVNNGNVALTNAGGGTYTFTIPAEDVIVTASILSTYSITLPANMAIVGVTNAADSNGKYISGTVIKFAASLGYEATNVSDGTNTLEPDANGIYTVTVAAADINITATTESSNTIYLARATSDFTAVDGNILIGSTSHTVTIANNATITLSDVTITGGIVCAGTAEITLVGTNSISGLSRYDSNIDATRYTAGIQVGGSGTTLTIKGNGSLTANGALHSAGIGLTRAWDVTEDVIGGNIVINGGNITANGGVGAAGIGAGFTKDPNNSSERKAIVGNITIKGGTVTAVGGNGADGIGAGDNTYDATYQIGTVTIYDDIDMVDASSISESVTYMHVDNETETNVTASASTYFTIIENGNRRIIVQKVTPTIADVPDQTYTGSAITPEPTVIAGSLSLTKGTDYVYSYTNNTNVGTAKVRATFQGNYASLGYVEKEFKIVKSMTNNDISITIPSQTWTGNELTPVITVKDGENVLTENTDYTVTAPSGPVQDSGNHAYTITGMGNYAGSREAMFTITPFLTYQFGAVYVYQDQNGKTALLDGTSVEPVDIDFNHNIIVNHVTSNRVFTPGLASTVMLPFNYTCNGEEGGTFYKFVGVKKENNKWVATMQDTGNDTNKQGTLEANTPYLFMPAATTMTFPNINGSVWLFTRGGGSGGNCETADPGSHWTFKGTYRYIEWTAGTTDPNFTQYAEEIGRAYGFAGVAKDGINVGDFVRVASGAKIRPMRAYLLWNNEPNSANARSFTRGAAATDEELPQSITVRLVGSNGETTGIGEIDTKTGEMTFDSEAWYTLDGVRLSGKPSKKGLYINNGKKVVIK